MLTVVAISHFYNTWAIFQKFIHGDLNQMAFFVLKLKRERTKTIHGRIHCNKIKKLCWRQLTISNTLLKVSTFWLFPRFYPRKFTSQEIHQQSPRILFSSGCRGECNTTCEYGTWKLFYNVYKYYQNCLNRFLLVLLLLVVLVIFFSLLLFLCCCDNIENLYAQIK